MGASRSFFPSLFASSCAHETSSSRLARFAFVFQQKRDCSHSRQWITSRTLFQAPVATRVYDTIHWITRNVLMILFQQLVIYQLEGAIQPLNWDQMRAMCLLVLYSAQRGLSPDTTFYVKRVSLFVCSLPMSTTLLQRLKQVIITDKDSLIISGRHLPLLLLAR